MMFAEGPLKVTSILLDPADMVGFNLRVSPTAISSCRLLEGAISQIVAPCALPLGVTCILDVLVELP